MPHPSWDSVLAPPLPGRGMFQSMPGTESAQGVELGTVLHLHTPGAGVQDAGYPQLHLETSGP